MNRVRTVVRWVAVLPILLYRWFISPMLPAACNYTPSCSRYAVDAVLKHGVWRGLVMGAMRIGRCSARYHGGEDPVPDVADWKALREEYRSRRVR